jgi:hypothetical protein
MLKLPDKKGRLDRNCLTGEIWLTHQTRCDGTQPSCKTCDVYQDECRYERPPPMSQVIGMAQRLQDAEDTIEELKKALDRATMQPQISKSPTSLTMDLTTQREPSLSIADAASPSHSQVQVKNESRSDLSLDERGKVTSNPDYRDGSLPLTLWVSYATTARRLQYTIHHQLFRRRISLMELWIQPESGLACVNYSLQRHWNPGRGSNSRSEMQLSSVTYPEK